MLRCRGRRPGMRGYEDEGYGDCEAGEDEWLAEQAARRQLEADNQ